MIKKALVTAFTLAASTSAWAGSDVSLFFVPHTEFDTGSIDREGDGFGISGRFNIWSGGRIDVDYSATEYDKQSGTAGDVDIDVRQTRVGYNALFNGNNSAITTNVRLEAAYLSVDTGTNEDSETGFGAHAGIALQANPAASIFAEVGYIKIDEAQGPEINVGFDYKLSPIIGLFGQYRGTMLADDGTDFDLTDFRIGGRVYF